MEIIKLQKKDIKNALDLVWTVFQEYEAPDYSKQGIEEFRQFITYSSIMEKYDNGELCFWGYKDSGGLVGIIATRGINHICLLFVYKEYHRQGIAKSLFQTVKDNCKSQNVRTITVNSSPYAVKVYHRLGFINTDKEQDVNGIIFTPMSYLIY